MNNETLTSLNTTPGFVESTTPGDTTTIAPDDSTVTGNTTESAESLEATESLEAIESVEETESLEATEAVSWPEGGKDAFFDHSLPIMGLGMLGIFIVLGLIAVATISINKLFPAKKDK